MDDLNDFSGLINDKTTKSNYKRSLTQLSHNLQKYISLTLQRTLKNFAKREIMA